MNGLIERTTYRWFEEVAARMHKDARPTTPEDRLLFCVFPLAYNYCSAIFRLIEADHKLPAMALLRVLAELTLRVMWCLYENNPEGERPTVRIMRWLKTACGEEIKRLQRMLPSAGEEGRERIERQIALLETEKKKTSCQTRALYNELDKLPDLVKHKLYPLLYGSFNRAIHPDPVLFADLTKPQGDELVFLRDPDKPSAHVLRICAMTNAYHLLSIVYFHYGWDSEPMKAEYLAIEEGSAN